MTVEELIQLLEPHKDKSLSRNYTVEVVDNKLTIKQKKRAVKTKAEVMAEVVEKIKTKNHNYNFKEFAYAFEHFCREFGYTYSARQKEDTLAIKKVFPNNKSFGRHELAIIFTFIRIFDKQIKTSTYISPSWGGILYAMPKIEKAIRATEVREQKVQQSQLADEVY